MHRIGLRNKPGTKPQWRWTKETGKAVREGKKGGIDWWRYQQEILIPFAQQCKVERPSTVVQEDKAPAHNSKHQNKVFMDADILRIIWCGNSPDLNQIEPCWLWMKRQTTRKGAPKTRKEAERRWVDCWINQLSQERIRRWIKRMPRHLKEIIRLKGGNEYRKGYEDSIRGSDIRPYDSAGRKLRYRLAKEQE